MMEDISRAILSSLFHATELHGDDDHELKDIEIQPEDFKLHFHKIMAHLYNHLKEVGEPVTFDVAFVYLSQQRVFDQVEIINIMASTPFGTKRMVQQYIDILRNDNKKDLIGRI